MSEVVALPSLPTGFEQAGLDMTHQEITIAAAVVLATVSCATILSGGRLSQRVEVLSTPPGAEVYLDEEAVGTPTKVEISRKTVEPQIRIVEPSGNSRVRRLRRGLSSGIGTDIAGGIFLGYATGARYEDFHLGAAFLMSLVPVVVDLLTGAAFEFPSQVEFDLSPERRQPGTQQSVRSMPPHGRVLRGDVQPARRLDVRPVLDVPQLHDLLERRREIVDGPQEQVP